MCNWFFLVEALFWNRDNVRDEAKKLFCFLLKYAKRVLQFCVLGSEKGYTCPTEVNMFEFDRAHESNILHRIFKVKKNAVCLDHCIKQIFVLNISLYLRGHHVKESRRRYMKMLQKVL